MLILNLIAFAALVYGLAFGLPAALWALCKRLGLPCEIEDFTGRAPSVSFADTSLKEGGKPSGGLRRRPVTKGDAERADCPRYGMGGEPVRYG